jgi:outer membrane protein OmpA-like peptidoglycan-associated protein
MGITCLCAAAVEETGDGSGRPRDCLALRSETEFSDAAGVWWGDRGRSFGNYLPFERAELPEKEPEQDPRVIGLVYFELDESVLLPEAKEVCEQAYQYLEAHPGDNVHIQGYCCDLAPNAYNMRLGRRRARAVKDYLVERGIDAARITTRSFGEERLIPGTIPEERERNRRAVIMAIETAGERNASRAASERPAGETPAEAG